MCFYTNLKYKRSQQKTDEVFILEKEAAATQLNPIFFKDIWSPYVQKQNLQNSYAFCVFSRQNIWRVKLFYSFIFIILS